MIRHKDTHVKTATIVKSVVFASSSMPITFRMVVSFEKTSLLSIIDAKECTAVVCRRNSVWY